jgi:Xaa-Pro dipeptidase
MTETVSSKELIFDQAEYEARMQKVRQEMARRELDVMLVHTAQNIFYLTGHYTFAVANYQCAFITPTGAPVIVLRDLEAGNARSQSWLPDGDIIGWEDTDDPIELTLKTMRERGFAKGRIGLEEHSFFVSARTAACLRRGLGDAEVVDAGGAVEVARRVKSPREIEYMRKACEFTAAGNAAAIAEIQPGNTENDVAAAAFSGMVRAGSEFLANGGPIITSGPRSGIPHTTFKRRVLEQGDAVLLEMGAAYNRYMGPLMRCAVIGKPSDQIKRFSDLCLEALNDAIEAVKPGRTIHDVDEACRSVFERAGLYEYYKKRTGYSVGIGFAPGWGEDAVFSVQKDNPLVLEPGMTFHMPPAMRMPGEFAVGFSETVAVTETGVDVLSNFPRELAIK